jgi:hypothetical protein
MLPNRSDAVTAPAQDRVGLNDGQGFAPARPPPRPEHPEPPSSWHGRDVVTLARRKSEPTGNTNFDLNWRAGLRPYLREAEVRFLRPTHPGTVGTLKGSHEDIVRSIYL